MGRPVVVWADCKGKDIVRFFIFIYARHMHTDGAVLQVAVVCPVVLALAWQAAAARRGVVTLALRDLEKK